MLLVLQVEKTDLYVYLWTENLNSYHFLQFTVDNPELTTRKGQHLYLGWRKLFYNILGRSVHRDPRVLSLYHTIFTCNLATLAILDTCLCNMCTTKTNKQSLHFVK